MFLLFCLISFSHFASSDTKNILVLSGSASPSHHIWISAVVRALAARQHNVTFVSFEEEQKFPPNVHYLHLDGVLEKLQKSISRLNVTEQKQKSVFSGIVDLTRFCEMAGEAIVHSNGLKALLDYPEDFNFGAILHDSACGNYLLKILPEFNNPPIVQLSVFGNPPFLIDLVGGHNYPAYVPHYRTSYGIEMSFFERIHNAATYVFDRMQRNLVLYPKLDELCTRAFGTPAANREIIAALALVNSHPAIGVAEPIPPNVIEVAGLHIGDPRPLPKKLENFIRSSMKGSVLFSLGTNLQSEAIPQEKLQLILNAFKEMPEYNFLWKFESDFLRRQPTKNVMVEKWLPQRDILAHPKLKAFITHSGLLSTQEAIWYGVPMISIPFVSDQHRNSQKVVAGGIAERVLFPSMTKDELKQKIQRVLENNSYATNIQVLSRRFRDQKEKPLDRAVWWLEYVLRHPNSEHLRSPVVQLGFLIGNSLDVLLLFILAILLVLLVTCKILALVFGSTRNSKL